MTEREHYVETMDHQLSEWNSTIDKLRKKIQSLPTNENDKHLEQIDFLELTRDKLKIHIETIRAFSEDDWKQTIISVERAQHELETALRNLADKLRV